MGLNRYGETLYLTDPDGVVVDSFVSGRLDETSSCGRVSMTDPIVYYFDRQTPGEVNPTVGLKGPAPTPVSGRTEMLVGLMAKNTSSPMRVAMP